MKKLSLFALLLLLSTSLLLWGCSSDDDDGDGGDNPVVPGPTENVGSITGLVNSASKSPLENVTVCAGGVTTLTNQNGYFVLSNVPMGEQVMEVAKDEYMSTHRMVTVLEGRSTHYPDIMLADAEVVAIDSGNDARVPLDGGMIDFTADSFVTGDGSPYTGQVVVTASVLTPDDPEFFGAFPGLFEGERTDGTTTPFESYGFMNVELSTPSKAELQLAPGATATLTIDIAPGQQATAPSTVPLWYFDDDDGVWYEEGEGTRNADRYTAEVSHFTPWNWDIPSGQLCRIEGYVIDGEGAPIQGAFVVAQGDDAAIRDETYTNAAGFFSLRARSSSNTNVWATRGGESSAVVGVIVSSDCPAPIELASPLVIAAPVFVASLTWSESPEDLDSHLLVPMTWNDDYDYYHLYYDTDGSLDGPPFAELDQDDMYSYGPENITGLRFYEGRYQYWVNDYDTDRIDPVDGSGAQVRLELDGGLWLFDVDDVQRGGLTDGYWHVFDFTVNAQGGVSVIPVMQYQDFDVDGLHAYDWKKSAKTK